MALLKRFKDRLTGKSKHKKEKDGEPSSASAELKTKDQKVDARTSEHQTQSGAVVEETPKHNSGSSNTPESTSNAVEASKVAATTTAQDSGSSNAPESTSNVVEASKVGATTTARNVPEANEESVTQQAAPVQSMWDIAYVNFKKLNKENAEEYEELLLEESKTNADRSSEPPPTRKEQLNKIIEAGTKKQEEDEIRVGLFGKKISVSAATSKFANLVLTFKDFIGEAIKVSPEASLAWAGVSLMIPILTMPETAKQANNAGLTYITLRMQYFARLERLMLRENQSDKIDGNRDEVVERFKENLEMLYRQIIEFQIKSVLMYYEHRAKRLWHVYFESVDWSGIVASIKELEEGMTKEQETLINEVMRKDLQGLKDVAERSYSVQSDMLKNLGEMKEILRDIAQNTKVPTSLPTAPTAIFNSRDDRDEEEDIIISCSEGTRVKLLEDVQQWTSDPERETLLWLHGPAGIGKSTVAYTVAERLDQQQDLAASYFFRRGKVNRNAPGVFFPTLARQLVHTVPEFGMHLEDALEKASGGSMTEEEVRALSLEQQFKTLIWDPLQHVSETSALAGGKFIVIDALDECEGPNVRKDTEVICKKLLSLQESKPVRLRVLLTSRDTKSIVENLGVKTISVHPIDGLADYDSETKGDISRYIVDKLEYVRAKEMKNTEAPWPDLDRREKLITMATSPSPLFIYASTLCRFVYDGTGRHDPEDQLEQWLQNTSSKSRLGSVYKPVLRQLVFGDEKKPDPLSSTALAELNNILGALVLLYAPLPLQSLADLLNLAEDRLRFRLQNLRSIIHVPKDSKKPVQILHTSLREYLLDAGAETECGVKVDSTATHHFLYLKCIDNMKKVNAEDAKVKSEGDDADAIQETKSSASKYAPLYWAHHLKESLPTETGEKEIVSIFQGHSRLWLNSLRLTGQLHKGAAAIPYVGPSDRYELHSDNIARLQTPLEVYFNLQGLPIIARYLRHVAADAKDKRPTNTPSQIDTLLVTVKVAQSQLSDSLLRLGISASTSDQVLSSLQKVKWLSREEQYQFIRVFTRLSIIMRQLFAVLGIDSLDTTAFKYSKQVWRNRNAVSYLHDATTRYLKVVDKLDELKFPQRLRGFDSLWVV